MEDCIFCKIVSGEIPARKVYEDESFLAFLDAHPVSPGHTLLIPKSHYQWFYDLPDELYSALFIAVKKISLNLKKERNADYIKLGIVGVDVSHVHVHLIPRTFADKDTVI